MNSKKITSRELLQAIGLAHHSGTMIVPYMMIAPATTDPKAAQIIMLVRALQTVLYQLGATDVQNTGELDPPTARAMRMVAGPDWLRMSWGANVAAVVSARDIGMRLTPAPTMGDSPMAGVPIAVSGPLDFLPDIPGGAITYGVIGFLVYRHFTKRRRA